MSDREELQSEEVQFRGPIASISDVERAVAQIQAANKKANWESQVEISLGTLRWKPAAVTRSRKAVLHVCLTGAIPQYIQKRLSAAVASGIKVFIALPMETLYSAEVLDALSDLDADVFVLGDRLETNLRPRHFLAAMADLEVPTAPGTRVRIAKAVHSKLGLGTKQEKGRRFEALLAFLLSQVADFRVVDRNFRTATQEIDIVVQINSFSRRSWQLGVPYLLVEAKNTRDRTPQAVVTTLITKIRTKGKSCKIGLLFSTSGFTSDALQDELRYSESENRIIMIGPSGLESIVEARYIDKTLDDIVRQGRMR